MEPSGPRSEQPEQPAPDLFDRWLDHTGRTADGPPSGTASETAPTAVTADEAPAEAPEATANGTPDSAVGSAAGAGGTEGPETAPADPLFDESFVPDDDEPAVVGQVVEEVLGVAPPRSEEPMRPADVEPTPAASPGRSLPAVRSDAADERGDVGGPAAAESAPGHSAAGEPDPAPAATAAADVGPRDVAEPYAAPADGAPRDVAEPRAAPPDSAQRDVAQPEAAPADSAPRGVAQPDPAAADTLPAGTAPPDVGHLAAGRVVLAGLTGPAGPGTAPAAAAATGPVTPPAAQPVAPAVAQQPGERPVEPGPAPVIDAGRAVVAALGADVTESPTTASPPEPDRRRRRARSVRPPAPSTPVVVPEPAGPVAGDVAQALLATGFVDPEPGGAPPPGRSNARESSGESPGASAVGPGHDHGPDHQDDQDDKAGQQADHGTGDPVGDRGPTADGPPPRREPLPPVVEFPPRSGVRRLTGALLLACLVATALTGWRAYQERTELNLAMVVTLGVLTLVIWGVRAGSTLTRLVVRGGLLEVHRDGGRFVFDLTSRYTPVQVIGEPGRRGWKVLFLRRGMSPFVIDSSMVDPHEFTSVLRYYRPE